MIENSLKKLETICQLLPAQLALISEEDFAFIPAPGKWNKKQILGHLIDSATNNHHRFVRGQFERDPSISYDQDLWNKAGHYAGMPTTQLISFWALYNKQIVELVKRIPGELLDREFNTGKLRTISWLFDDYLIHLEHHLEQITPGFLNSIKDSIAFPL